MNKNVNAYIIVLLTVIMATTSYSQPVVDSLAGNFVHKGTLTIIGSSFGTKNPAAPFLWDACDDQSPNDLSVLWPTDTYPKTCSGTPGDQPYLMAYRSSFHGFSDMPNPYVTKFLSAAHTTCNGNWDSPFADNLVTTAPFGADKLFLTYYYRMPGSWSQETSSFGDNLKEVSSNGGNGTYLAGTDNYIDWCNSDTPMLTNPSDAGMRGCIGSSPCSGVSGCGSNTHWVNNPMQDWVHIQIRWDTDGVLYDWSDGSEVSEQQSRLAYSIRTDGSNPVTISLGGFNRFPRNSATGNYRCWAAIYMDNTYSRVMLGNKSTWQNCTIREPQIPTTWSDSQITVQVNMGSLAEDAEIYLYVFNAADEFNQNGKLITGSKYNGPSKPDTPDVEAIQFP